LTGELKRFWASVLTKTPPPVDGSEATTDALKRLYPHDDGETIALPMEANDWDLSLQCAKRQVTTWEADVRKHQNKIKAALGTATTGDLPGGGSYTFKDQTNHYEAKEAWETTFRVLRRKA
jgi:predicted phage-related endonuclease